MLRREACKRLNLADDPRWQQVSSLAGDLPFVREYRRIGGSQFAT
jgi:hypothetical protein